MLSRQLIAQINDKALSSSSGQKGDKFYDFHWLIPIFFAGLPSTIANGSTSQVTTEPALKTALLPIAMFPMMQTRGQITVLSPIAEDLPSLEPMFTNSPIVTFLPITQCGFITIFQQLGKYNPPPITVCD
jgi:hypothetical protein